MGTIVSSHSFLAPAKPGKSPRCPTEVGRGWRCASKRRRRWRAETELREQARRGRGPKTFPEDEEVHLDLRGTTASSRLQASFRSGRCLPARVVDRQGYLRRRSSGVGGVPKDGVHVVATGDPSFFGALTIARNLTGDLASVSARVGQAGGRCSLPHHKNGGDRQEVFEPRICWGYAEGGLTRRSASGKRPGRRSDGWITAYVFFESRSGLRKMQNDC